MGSLQQSVFCSHFAQGSIVILASLDALNILPTKG